MTGSIRVRIGVRAGVLYFSDSYIGVQVLLPMYSRLLVHLEKAYKFKCMHNATTRQFLPSACMHLGDYTKETVQCNGF